MKKGNWITFVLFAIIAIQIVVGFFIFAFVSEWAGGIIGAFTALPFAALLLWMFLRVQGERIR